MFREETTSAISAGFHACGFSIPVELEFGGLVFVEEGKPENPEQNPRTKARTEQQTQPTYTWHWPESNSATLLGGRAFIPACFPN